LAHGNVGCTISEDKFVQLLGGDPRMNISPGLYDILFPKGKEVIVL
jgi:hypothetical protein